VPLSGISDGRLFFYGDGWRCARVLLRLFMALRNSFAQTQYSVGSEHRRIHEKRFLGGNASV